MKFSETIFKEKYYPFLEKRKETFLKIFQYLESLNKTEYFIIETGTMRAENDIGGAGWSTKMFDEFINYYDGTLISIDINEYFCNFAKSKTSDKTKLIASDSVLALDYLSKQNFSEIDCLYLDSFDVDFNNIHPSAFHHIKEFAAINSKLNPKSLIVVDDNLNGKGKGTYLDSYMQDIKCKKFFDEYQIAWIYGDRFQE